jgi:hypothetical protein
MPRRRFRYDRELDKMVEVDVDPASVFEGHAVIGEIEPFRSVVDGTLIRSRAQLKEYMARKNLVTYDPTAKAEGDRYEKARQDKEMHERLYEYVDRLVQTGKGPHG